MDLMTASTSYQALKTKYQDFRAPTARILSLIHISGPLGAGERESDPRGGRVPAHAGAGRRRGR